MNEWARLVDRYASELKKYELVCSFCGLHLSDTNVNSECNENVTGAAKGGPSASTGYGARGNTQAAATSVPTTSYFTEDAPPPEGTGNKKHWFGKPSLKGYKQNPFRTQTAGLLKEEVILQNPEAAQVLKKIYEIDHHMKLDLDGKFR